MGSSFIACVSLRDPGKRKAGVDRWHDSRRLFFRLNLSAPFYSALRTARATNTDYSTPLRN